MKASEEFNIKIETNLPSSKAISSLGDSSKVENSINNNSLNFKSHFFTQFMKKHQKNLIFIAFAYVFSTLIIISYGIIFYFLSLKLYSNDKEEVILNGQVLFGIYLLLGILSSLIKAFQK